jgi:UDP-N-acetylglucosamine/UDP-N-acetylgalactosamine diphosphorylase
MIRLGSDADNVCFAKANEAGQGHIFDGWDDLSSDGQRALIAQVEAIDFQLVKRLVQEHMSCSPDRAEGHVLNPAPTLGWCQVGREEIGLCRTLGEYAIRNDEVALVTAAADGGTFPQPTGLVPVGPVSGKSLLQLHAERIQAVNRRYKVSLRWLIFCHPAEKDRLAAHFKASGHFGLKCSDITFIAQDLLPVIDRRGKILLSSPGQIAMSPNGHGGILTQCMEERLDLLEGSGIRYLFYFQVDNALARAPDPLFLGHHIKNQAEVSTKAVRKTDPDERVGVICSMNGLLGVVEHTEIAEKDRSARAPDGGLLLRAANTGIHVFSIEFLRKLRAEGFQLSYRPVERITPYLGKRGKVVRPVKPNSLRFKTFIFEAIRKAERTSIIEVERAEEFSPVKNPAGPDSPETARRDLSRLHASWLRAAHAEIPEGAGTDAGPAVEVSPLYALDLDELREKLEVPVGAGAPHNGSRPLRWGDSSHTGAGGNILIGRG